MAEISQVAPLQVDIVSDVVCPWCIIGYKQLQMALDIMAGRPRKQKNKSVPLICNRRQQ
jgi:predicted DsbA family dithiol-disulfide isomerase